MNWSPIETSPTDGTRFLAVTKNGRMRVDDRRDTVHDSEQGADLYTHWMHLPDPPTLNLD